MIEVNLAKSRSLQDFFDSFGKTNVLNPYYCSRCASNQTGYEITETILDQCQTLHSTTAKLQSK